MLKFTGETIRLECNSQSFPLWWKENSAYISRKFLSDLGRRLVIPEAKLNDSGMYYCEGKNGEGQTFSARSNVFIGGK